MLYSASQSSPALTNSSDQYSVATASWLSACSPLIIFSCLFISVASLGRLTLAIQYIDRFSTGDLLPWLFIQGLRVDLATVAQIILFPFLVIVLTFPWKVYSKIGNYVIRPLLAVVITFSVFLEVLTSTYIQEYNTRPNYLLVEYLSYPKEVMSMLWHGYRVQLLVEMVLLPVVFYFSLSIMKFRFPWKGSVNGAMRLIVAVVGVFVLALFIRSSFDHRPINPSKVAISDDPLVNSLVLNSLYSLGYSVYQKARYDDDFNPAFKMPMERVNELVEKQLKHNEVSPGQPLLGNRNVVLLLQESLGAEFVGALGGLDLTPSLDNLRKEGIWFEQMYATGTRSVRGIEAVVAGFPPTPARSVLKLPKSQHGFYSFACDFKKQGYETVFIYGGESHFDNMKSFLLNSCFDKILDLEDFDDPAFVGSWGVSDEDMYAKVDEVLSQEQASPTFIFAFSVSNHSPWEFPDGRIEIKGSEKATRNNAVRYADHSIGQFFKSAKTKPYWDDSLFMVVADHNSRVYGATTFPIEHFHIPALILGAGLSPVSIQKVCSQIDLMPTVFSLLGWQPSSLAIGSNVFSDAFKPGRAMMQYYDTMGYLEADKFITLKSNEPIQTYLFDGNALHPKDVNIEEWSTTVEHAKAYHIWPQYVYHNRLYQQNR